MKSSKGAFSNGDHDLVKGLDFIGISCVFVCHDGKKNILMHRRSKNCRDEHGKWDFGGGAHEFGSTIDETARREVREEYGTDIIDLRFLYAFDAIRKRDDGKTTHWLALLYTALIDPKHAKNNEPFKIDEIGWFKINELPSPLHSQIPLQLKAIKSKMKAAGVI